MQMRKGRYFLFKHLAGASSWNEPCVQRLLKLPGVEVAEADQCQFGLVTADPTGKDKPALKPTRFASNSWLLLEELTRRCPRDHEHQPLMGGRAAAAAEYPPDLCHAICRGLVRQTQYDRQSYVAMPKQGKSELKALVRKLSRLAAVEAKVSARPSEFTSLGSAAPPDSRNHDVRKNSFSSEQGVVGSCTNQDFGVERVRMLRKQAAASADCTVRQDL